MRAAEIQNLITGLVNGIGKNDLINLSPGKIITAFLKEVQGNACILVCEGKEIAARLETDVPAGQTLKLLVEGEKNGQTVLKLLSDATVENELSLKNIITRLGLTENRQNLKLVEEMIKQQMPLTPNSTTRLSGFIKSLDIAEPEIWIPVFMENNGVKLTPQNFTRVNGLLTDLQFINEDLAKLSAGLKGLISTAGSWSGLVETAQKVVTILTGLELNPDQGREILAAKLESAVRLLTEPKPVPGQGLEGNNILKDNNVLKGDSAPKGDYVSTGGNALMGKNDQNGSAVNRGIPIRPHIQGLNSKELEGVLELGPMLEKMALNLQEQGASEHKEIIRLIQNVTEKIEFIRNFNIQTEAGRENMMVFYSTMQFGNRPEPFRLVVKYRDGKEKNSSFSNCRLQIKLNTPGLGPVKCEVEVANKNLTLQFITTSDAAGRALDMFSDILAERLSQMSYSVNYLPSKVETVPENELIADEGAGIQGFFQLDLTV